MIPLIFFRIPTKPCPDSIHCSRYFKRVFFYKVEPNNAELFISMARLFSRLVSYKAFQHVELLYQT